MRGINDYVTARRLHTPLVGRDSELEELRRAIAEVDAGGGPRLVIVVGGPGIGKSRLLDEFLASVSDGATILRARCVPEVERSRPSVRELLGAIVPEDVPTAGVHEAVSARLAGHGRTDAVARGVALALDPSSEGSREEALWAVRELLAWEARSRPVIVLLDDAHWVDESTLDLVMHLGGGTQGAALLVIAAGRPEFLDGRSAWVSDITMRLEPLSAEASADLLEGALEGSHLDLKLETSLTSSAEGNPLFLEQTLRMLVDNGRIVRTDDGWMAAPGLVDAAVPDGIRALLQARLDLLSSDARRVLESAAVVGTTFLADAVAALVPPELREGLRRHLGDLADREFVLDEDPADAGHYRFHHALLRDAAYSAMTKSSRADLHEVLAGWLESEGRPAESIGSHLERAALLWTEIVAPRERERQIAGRAGMWLARAAGEAAHHGRRENAVDRFDRARRMVAHAGSEDDGAGTLVGRVAVQLGEWDAAIELLGGLESSSDAGSVKDLGLALTRRHRRDREGAGFRRGHQLLERAAELDPTDADALASLAGAWRGADDALAHDLYRRALERDASDPYALGNHVEYEIVESGALDVVERLGPQLTAALVRRQTQAAINDDPPWCHYDVGRFSLLLGDPYEALSAYAKGLQRSPSAFMVETSLATLTRLRRFESSLPGHSWCRRLLLLGLGATFGSRDAHSELEEMATPGTFRLASPIVVVAGGASPETEERTRSYGPGLHQALDGFRGTVISGGTTQGVPAIVGDLGEGTGVRTVGFLPERLPPDVTPDVDARRYTELRRTAGNDFTPLEPLQYWTDLTADGVNARDVRIIGIGGGRIAAIEFRLGLAIGAMVGVIRGSGREADELLEDADWSATERLDDLRPEGTSIGAFLRS